MILLVIPISRYRYVNFISQCSNVGEFYSTCCFYFGEFLETTTPFMTVLSRDM